MGSRCGPDPHNPPLTPRGWGRSPDPTWRGAARARSAGTRGGRGAPRRRGPTRPSAAAPQPPPPPPPPPAAGTAAVRLRDGVSALPDPPSIAWHRGTHPTGTSSPPNPPYGVPWLPGAFQRTLRGPVGAGGPPYWGPTSAGGPEGTETHPLGSLGCQEPLHPSMGSFGSLGVQRPLAVGCFTAGGPTYGVAVVWGPCGVRAPRAPHTHSPSSAHTVMETSPPSSSSSPPPLSTRNTRTRPSDVRSRHSAAPGGAGGGSTRRAVPLHAWLQFPRSGPRPKAAQSAQSLRRRDPREGTDPRPHSVSIPPRPRSPRHPRALP